MIIRSCLGFLDPLPHIWQRSQKFQMHIIESGEVVKPLATLATLTNLPENDAHNRKWRGCKNSGNLGTSDKLATEWCTLYLLISFRAAIFVTCILFSVKCKSGSMAPSVTSSRRIPNLLPASPFSLIVRALKDLQMPRCRFMSSAKLCSWFELNVEGIATRLIFLLLGLDEVDSAIVTCYNSVQLVTAL